ncbi:hypothetical protein FOB80_07145 [Aerococcus viridans]|nr:hypothetical protein FOB80_07145 [Aerococcus viridans]
MEYSTYMETSLEKLKNYIKESEKRPIIFVGAGLSRRYFDAPKWSELIERLFEDNSNIEKPVQYYLQEHKGNLLEVASVLVDYYRDYYWTDNMQKSNPKSLYENNDKSIFLKYHIARIINEHYNEFDIDTNFYKEEIALLKKLTPEAIITTNYDKFLDDIFSDYDVMVGQNSVYDRKSTNSFKILKIHGSVDDYEKIVINKDDYEKFTETQLYLTAKLLTYFIEHPVVFIGYSLSDDNVKIILQNIKKIMNETDLLMENMWFIDYVVDSERNTYFEDRKRYPISDTESVGMNYISVSSFKELYAALYQDSININSLKSIENTMYNLVKSSSITNLEVDVANVNFIEEPKNLLELMTRKDLFFNMSQITDANLASLNYPYTPTLLSKEVFEDENSTWQEVYKLIYKIEKDNNIKLRETNSRYHIVISGNIHRYSGEMLSLLKKEVNGEDYNIEI